MIESIENVIPNLTLLITRDPPNKSQSSFGVVMFVGRKPTDPIVTPDIFLKLILIQIFIYLYIITLKNVFLLVSFRYLIMVLYKMLCHLLSNQ